MVLNLSTNDCGRCRRGRGWRTPRVMQIFASSPPTSLPLNQARTLLAAILLIFLWMCTFFKVISFSVLQYNIVKILLWAFGYIFVFSWRQQQTGFQRARRIVCIWMCSLRKPAIFVIQYAQVVHCYLNGFVFVSAFVSERLEGEGVAELNLPARTPSWFSLTNCLLYKCFVVALI